MKLTNQLRDRIIQEVVAVTTNKAEDSLKKRSQALAMQLYNHIYPKHTRDLMKSLPVGFMPEDKCLKFNLGGMNINICTAEPVRVPFSPNPDSYNIMSGNRNGCQRLGNIANEELQKKYTDLHDENEKHKEWVNKVRAETKSLLYSLHTYPQLEKTWPEGKKFYSKYAPKNGDSQLPALLISDLNKTLGIG